MTLTMGATLYQTATLAALEAAAAAATRADVERLTLFDCELLLSATLLTRMHVFSYITNVQPFGYLIDSTGYDPSKAHPDLFLVQNNKDAFAEMYLNDLVIIIKI